MRERAKVVACRQSYDVTMEMEVAGQKARSQLDLKNPCFRYTGQPVQPPPGSHTQAAQSPTDQYYGRRIDCFFRDRSFFLEDGKTIWKTQPVR